MNYIKILFKNVLNSAIYRAVNGSPKNSKFVQLIYWARGELIFQFYWGRVYKLASIQSQFESYGPSPDLAVGPKPTN